MKDCFCMELFQLFSKDKWQYCHSYICDSCAKNIIEAKNELVRENERLKELLGRVSTSG